MGNDMKVSGLREWILWIDLWFGLKNIEVLDEYKQRSITGIKGRDLELLAWKQKRLLRMIGKRIGRQVYGFDPLERARWLARLGHDLSRRQ